jgi:hypothetical protein
MTRRIRYEPGLGMVTEALNSRRPVIFDCDRRDVISPRQLSTVVAYGWRVCVGPLVDGRRDVLIEPPRIDE